MGPKSGWGGVVRIGYVRPVQFLDHLTVIISGGNLTHQLEFVLEKEGSILMSTDQHKPPLTSLLSTTYCGLTDVRLF